MSPRLIVLLGNPGRRYADTRHNIAWWVGDRLAESRRIAFHEGDGDFHIAQGRLGSVKIDLLKPTTFMNVSGSAVGEYCRRNRYSAGDLIIVSDDIDLPLGRIRIRSSGSSGGHRGLDSIIEEIGTDHVARCRCGVGPVPAGSDPAEFVLDPFPSEELIVARQMATDAASAVELMIARGVTAAANVYNRKPSAPPATPESEGGAQRPREDE